MAYKIFLSPSSQRANTYAYGNTTEDVQCGKIAMACKAALERCGFKVKLEQYDTMVNRVKHANAWGADLYVPIHTNAFNGQVTGTRIFYNNAEGKKAAQAVFDVLAPFTPGTSENIKVNSAFYEVNTPKIPVVYVEAEFHDTKATAKWIIEHTTEIGEHIAEGICNYYGVNYKTGAKDPNGYVYYQVVAGSFINRTNAENMQKKLKDMGIASFIQIKK